MGTNSQNFEKNGKGYFSVSGANRDETEFYMEIDRPQRLVVIYLTSDFKNPVRIIDYEVNEPVGQISGIKDKTALMHALVKGVKTFDLHICSSSDLI